MLTKQTLRTVGTRLENGSPLKNTILNVARKHSSRYSFPRHLRCGVDRRTHQRTVDDVTRLHMRKGTDHHTLQQRARLHQRSVADDAVVARNPLTTLMIPQHFSHVTRMIWLGLHIHDILHIVIEQIRYQRNNQSSRLVSHVAFHSVSKRRLL